MQINIITKVATGAVSGVKENIPMKFIIASSPSFYDFFSLSSFFDINNYFRCCACQNCELSGHKP